MILIVTLIFFCFGLIIGSFLNVVILRMNTGKSFGGRSACMSCKNPLSWYELIPVFSFLGLRGRCKNCKTKISIQYPLVELATGLIFAILFVKLQNVFFYSSLYFFITYGYYAILFTLLIIMAAYDLKHKIIPDVLSFIFGLVAFIGIFFFYNQISLTPLSTPMFYIHLPSVIKVLSGPLVALPFYLFWLVSKGKWMGLGDAKLAIGIGWMLPIAIAFSGIVLAFWTAALVGIALIFFKGYGMKSQIPFALYLFLGTFIAFMFSVNLFPVF